MIGISARPAVAKVIGPLVERLARSGVTPDAITILGTLGAVARRRRPDRDRPPVLGRVHRHGVRAARHARRRAGPGARRRLGVRRRPRLHRRPRGRRGDLRRARLVVLRRRGQPAAGPPRPALPRARRAHLLHQGAGRGCGPVRRRRRRRAHRAADPRPRRHRLQRSRASRTRCTSRCGSSSPAARSPSASDSSSSAGPAADLLRPPRHERGRRRAGPRPGRPRAAVAADRPAHRRRLRGGLGRGEAPAGAASPTGSSTAPAAGPRAGTAAGCASCAPTCASPPAARLTDDELDALTERAVRSYARYWQEAFRLPVIEPGRIVGNTVTTGQEQVDRLRAEGRPIVFALPHSGNWDAAAVWLVDWLGGPFMTVAERLKPESLYERFVAYRESLGIRVVPLTGGPRPSSEVLREWVSDGGTVCLLVDRDLGRTGTPVDVLRPGGHPAHGAGGAGRADRGRAGAGRLRLHRHGLVGALLPGGPGPGAGPTAGPGGHRHAGRGRRLHRRGSPSGPRTGTCSAGSGPTCPPTRPRGGGAERH